MSEGATLPGGRRDLVLGLLAIAGGVAVALLAARIRGMPGQPFSPGFFPGLVGGLAALVGAALAVRALRGRAPPIEVEDTEGHGPPLRLAAAWVVGGIVAAAWLLEPLGFLLVTVTWLTGFQLLLGVAPLRALLLALVLCGIAHQAFTHLLGVPLPPGELFLGAAG